MASGGDTLEVALEEYSYNIRRKVGEITQVTTILNEDVLEIGSEGDQTDLTLKPTHYALVPYEFAGGITVNVDPTNDVLFQIKNPRLGTGAALTLDGNEVIRAASTVTSKEIIAYTPVGKVVVIPTETGPSLDVSEEDFLTTVLNSSIRDIRAATFVYKNDKKFRVRMGFIADDVAVVAEELGLDGLIIRDSDDELIDYDLRSLVSILWERVRVLEDQVAALSP